MEENIEEYWKQFWTDLLIEMTDNYGMKTTGLRPQSTFCFKQMGYNSRLWYQLSTASQTPESYDKLINAVWSNEFQFLLMHADVGFRNENQHNKSINQAAWCVSSILAEVKCNEENVLLKYRGQLIAMIHYEIHWVIVHPTW